MPINAHPDYLAAEKRYLEAETDEQRLIALQDVIRKAPKHKGAENLRAQLRLRLKKLKEKLRRQKKSGKGKSGIKKADMQAVIVGKTNSGKSSLLQALTNARPTTSPNKFTTQHAIIGTMQHAGVNIQIIDMPAIESETFDTSLAHTADTIIIIIEKIADIQEIKKFLERKSKAKQIIVFNKSDKLDRNERRKTEATLKSKKLNFAIISAKTKENIEELKEKIFQSFDIIRVYTKEPGKAPTKIPTILKPNSTVKDVAEKIKKGLSTQIKEARLTGPSSKFSNQRVGLAHKLKDKDIIEFKTK